MDLRNRRRLQLVLIASVFVLPLAAAWAMAWLGWAPKAVSYGAPVQPERSVAGVAVQMGGKSPFAWVNDDAVWTLVALPGPDCAAHCLDVLDLVRRAKISLGTSASHLRLLYLGAPPPAAAVARGVSAAWMLAAAPAHAFAAQRPSAPDTLSAVLVTPDGKAFLHYAANFDVRGLQRDLTKVVH